MTSRIFEDPQRNYIKVSTDDIPSVDPLAVTKLVTRELNELPLDRRQGILEEIHGVIPGEDISLRCSVGTYRLATRRQKEDIALKQFQDELDRYYFSIPTQAETNIFALGGRNHSNFSAYRYARENNSELIKDRDFQLTFFGRGEEGSCPKKAAKRMLHYLEFVRQVYNTNDVLFRPITLSDLNEAIGSKTFMYEVAPFQMLPLRDPSGRRVFVHLRDIGPLSSPIVVRQQVGMYFAQCLSEDRGGGTVFVSFLHHIPYNLYNTKEYQNLQKMIETIPPKFSAVHLCFPEGPLYEIAKAAMMLLIGKENRQRLRLHVGSYQECKYALRSFGIPVDRLPVDLDFKPKYATKNKQFDLKYHSKWLSIREAKETAMFAAIGRDSRGKVVASGRHGVVGSYEGVMEAAREIRSKFVECPRHEDCLFGKGRPAMYHPGNIAMRRLLDERIRRFEAMPSLQKSVVVWEVVNCIKQGAGRFLKEDNGHAGVYVITDDETAFRKIAIAFRDLKKRRLKEGPKEAGEKSSSQHNGRRDSKSSAEKRERKRPATSKAPILTAVPALSMNGDTNIDMDVDSTHP